MDIKKDAMYQWRLKKAGKALEEVARREGVSVEKVYREIERGIRQARYSPDPIKRAWFAQIPCEGESPTPEELIAFGVTMLRENDDYLF